MPSLYSKTRVAVDLRSAASSDAAAIMSLPPNTSLRIINSKGEWHFVSTTLGRNLLISAFRDRRGYVPTAALTLKEVKEPPSATLKTLRDFVQELPDRLTALDLKTWLERGGAARPPWINNGTWERMTAGQQVEFKSHMKAKINQQTETWSDWLAMIHENGRTQDALIIEWLTILIGGRNMFPVRAQTIHPEPRASSGPPVWVNTDEVLKWTGHVRRDAQSMSSVDWYEVTLFKWDRENHGWFRGELLEEYVAPTADNDPDLRANANKVFDRSVPILRAPQDMAIGEHPNVKQYVDIFPVIGRHLTHRNLCGEFCAAALGNMDIFPFLEAWLADYDRAHGILHNNQATFLVDVKAMIDVIGLPHDELEFNSAQPLTARRLQGRLATGKKLIAGVGIKHDGEVHVDGTIAHWVVIVDCLPVGTNGWVRLYNPFNNREEVYPFSVFSAAQERLRAGLWVVASN